MIAPPGVTDKCQVEKGKLVPCSALVATAEEEDVTNIRTSVGILYQPVKNSIGPDPKLAVNVILKLRDEKRVHCNYCPFCGQDLRLAGEFEGDQSVTSSRGISIFDAEF